MTNINDKVAELDLNIEHLENSIELAQKRITVLKARRKQAIKIAEMYANLEKDEVEDEQVVISL